MKTGLTEVQVISGPTPLTIQRSFVGAYCLTLLPLLVRQTGTNPALGAAKQNEN
jgi:hypothetical protein